MQWTAAVKQLLSLLQRFSFKEKQTKGVKKAIMKNFVNTAVVEYTLCGRRCRAYSNSAVITANLDDNVIRGRILCKSTCGRWKLCILRNDTAAVVYSIEGSSPRRFVFRVNPDRSYTIKFISTPDCCLRLYNTPDAVTDTVWQDMDC